MTNTEPSLSLEWTVFVSGGRGRYLLYQVLWLIIKITVISIINRIESTRNTTFCKKIFQPPPLISLLFPLSFLTKTSASTEVGRWALKCESPIFPESSLWDKSPPSSWEDGLCDRVPQLPDGLHLNKPLSVILAPAFWVLAFEVAGSSSAFQHSSSDGAKVIHIPQKPYFEICGRIFFHEATQWFMGVNSQYFTVSCIASIFEYCVLCFHTLSCLQNAHLCLLLLVRRGRQLQCIDILSNLAELWVIWVICLWIPFPLFSVSHILGE